MDTKRLVTGMLLVVALVLAWQAFVTYLYRIHPEWRQPQQQAPATTPAGTTQPTTAPATTGAATQATTAPTTAVLTPATNGSSLRLAATTQPTTVVTLGSATKKDPTYAMALNISSQGAGLQQVVLNDYPKQIGSDALYVFQEPLQVGGAESARALATRSVTINGSTVDLANTNWHVDQQSADTAVFAVDIVGADGAPVLTVRKTFVLPPRTDPSLGFEPSVTYSFVNRTDRALTVRTAFNGTVLPPRELERGPDRMVMGGYNDSGTVVLERHAVQEFTPEKPSRDLIKNAKGTEPMLWAGAGSSYFNAIVLPMPLQAGAPNAAHIAHVSAEALNPQAEPDDREPALTFETADVPVPASSASRAEGKAASNPSDAQEVTVPLRVFLGPKERAVLDHPYYTSFPRSYSETLKVAGGCCAFLTFQPLINLLVWLLGAFHIVFRDWGLSIIGLVVVVRIILHPITKASTVSMQRMGKLGPEIERLKKKYADNQEELNRAMMQFYKEQGATPILGCLPLFLQMPIWIALWQALQSTFELRQSPFLWGFPWIGGYTWIKDLAKPDELIKFSNPIPLMIFGWHLYAINLLPILMAAVTWVQQKYQPKPPATTPEQEQQQKMMQWMSLLIPLMFYSMPSGLNLYYVTSMGLGIFEAKRIRDHIKQKEEAEKAGRVIVDAKPTRSGRKLQEETPQSRKKQGGLMGLFGRLQARAEELRREADRKGRK